MDRFGKINSIWLAHSTDGDIRFRASSGGFIKSFLCFLLDSHRIDYAIVTRTGGQENPLIPETIVTNRKDEIISTRTNSVYCENNPFRNINIWPGKRYAFVGLPCQIRRARLYPNMKCVISLICNHTPKLEFTREILDKLGVKEPDVSQIEYRGSGWPGCFAAHLKDGSTKTLSKYWSNGYMPERCRKCSEIGDNADIVTGDPWHLGLEKTDKSGSTLVICRNQLSSQLIKKAGKYVSIKPTGRAELNKSQGKHFRKKLRERRTGEGN